jgi:L-rhamnose mutarotase
MTMNRIAFKMKLNPGQKEEYRKRHDEIWPEMVHLLKKAGVHEYSIFLDEESNSLFAFQKIESSSSSQDFGSMKTVQKWWKYMADIMETNPDDSPVIKELEEVFNLE